jgi:hypothetical protein
MRTVWQSLQPGSKPRKRCFNAHERRGRTNSSAKTRYRPEFFSNLLVLIVARLTFSNEHQTPPWHFCQFTCNINASMRLNGGVLTR